MKMDKKSSNIKIISIDAQMNLLESDKIILGDYNYEADEHEQTHVNNPQYKFAEFCKNKYNYKNDFKDILHTDEDDDEFIRISDIYQSKSSGSIKLNSIDDISIIENQAPCFLENHLNYQDNDKCFNKTYYFDESCNSKENTNSNIQSKILQRYEEGYAFANIKNQNKEFNDGLKHPSYFRTESIYDRLRNQIKFQNRINANSRSKAYQKFINNCNNLKNNCANSVSKKFEGFQKIDVSVKHKEKYKN